MVDSKRIDAWPAENADVIRGHRVERLAGDRQIDFGAIGEGFKFG
jgi:hypothetical protein